MIAFTVPTTGSNTRKKRRETWFNSLHTGIEVTSYRHCHEQICQYLSTLLRWDTPEVWNSNQQHPSHIPCGNNITNKRANVCGEKKSIFKLSGVSICKE